MAAAFAVVGALGLSSCSTDADPPAPQPRQQAEVVVEPADKATGVSPAAALRVSVANATLGEVTLTEAGGRRIRGALATDRRSWTATEKPDFDKDYSYSSGTFRTVKPRKLIALGDGETAEGGVYGVARPVRLVFQEPGIKPKDRAAVERVLSVESTPSTEGSWGWVDGMNLTWQPKEYWQPGAKVTVRSSLRGVRIGEDAYGKNDFTVSFTIGRHQLVRADTDNHRMIVEQDGKKIREYPASYGKESDPKLVTRNGRYFVMEMKPKHHMERFNFDAYNGEFIHQNEDTVNEQGRSNVSQGCANLSAANAKDYYGIALPGDPRSTCLRRARTSGPTPGSSGRRSRRSPDE
ncbi:L,D-transpeptidase [Allokutzneria oryzae]|uniref:Ig-like domain-containing protein n=1 Tax=Allokutzneria oryzae TaxID=1378989 RepID=A0ABV6A1F0_9PSEU